MSQNDVTAAQREAARMRREADTLVADAKRGDRPLTTPAGKPTDEQVVKNENLRVDDVTAETPSTATPKRKTRKK